MKYINLPITVCSQINIISYEVCPLNYGKLDYFQSGHPEVVSMKRHISWNVGLWTAAFLENSIIHSKRIWCFPHAFAPSWSTEYWNPLDLGQAGHFFDMIKFGKWADTNLSSYQTSHTSVPECSLLDAMMLLPITDILVTSRKHSSFSNVAINIPRRCSLFHKHWRRCITGTIHNPTLGLATSLSLFYSN